MICNQKFPIQIPVKLSMLKTLFLGILIWIASTLLVANVALSNPSPERMLLIAQTPVTENPLKETQPVELTNPEETSSPETANTTLKNTSTENKKVIQPPENEESLPKVTPDSEQSQSSGPYDMEAIQAFNRALYGS